MWRQIHRFFPLRALLWGYTFALRRKATRLIHHLVGHSGRCWNVNPIRMIE